MPPIKISRSAPVYTMFLFKRQHHLLFFNILLHCDSSKGLLCRDYHCHSCCYYYYYYKSFYCC